MKHIKVSLEDISEFDLKLAKNPQVLPLIEQIVSLSSEEREQQRQEIQQKIGRGEASLFEEHVYAKLLEPRKAEWIRVIYKNLPRIEQELGKYQPSDAEQAQAPPGNLHIEPAAPIVDEYPSELLNFLATQKPPTPPKSSLESKRFSPRPVSTSPPRSRRWSIQDVALGLLLLSGFVLSMWYVLASEQESPPITTFDNPQAEQRGESDMSGELQAQIQDQFDKAVHALRFEDFEQGKQKIFELLDQYPQSSFARDARLILADMYRQRQNNPDEAIEHYQLFLEQYPQSSQAGIVLLKMGYAYEDLQDALNAKETYRLLIARQGAKSRLGQLAQERLSRLENQE
ncbi:tol-pal system protein YbgF [Candidatus Vecturithrix granuli]|uniref:Tol-pal system protein YbgF n=1 Tax=Vecturithrix granuli TaxID=1499967 RepID=A0A081C1Y7_VECG1|nr:tol-pal system protein YbgF [Candidatus Vecturithrix granuli]